MTIVCNAITTSEQEAEYLIQGISQLGLKAETYGALIYARYSGSDQSMVDKLERLFVACKDHEIEYKR